MRDISPELMRWLIDLHQQVERTNSNYATLCPTGRPIPFFGDIRTARVLTVGVNPSPTEFNQPRWEAITNESQWAHRLLNYFHSPGIPWHKWFLPWEASLRLLGCSYEDRTAAHLDLSPRSTAIMGKVTDELRQSFCAMVDGDVHWLFEALRFAPSARLILPAGSMIKPKPKTWLPIGDYLFRQAEQNGAIIEPLSECNMFFINNLAVPLPIRSFSSGPSADDKFKLVADVFAERERLLSLLR